MLHQCLHLYFSKIKGKNFSDASFFLDYCLHKGGLRS
uniref:Uncharacterized protein n=1 Tax=Rhizophora mucronata TaxID=61149 RepID=A0A2P2R469_RHIMU